MRIYKNKAFSKWASKEGVTDQSLIEAVDEIESGLVDADLGGHVFKKRVAVGGRGKRGGVRTLLAYQKNDAVFFIYGFAKNQRANVLEHELRGLKAYAALLLSYSRKELLQAIDAGVLVEVTQNG